MVTTKSNNEQSRLVSEEFGKIKVLFVDDHQLVREIVTDYLENAGQYVIDQANSVSEAISRIEGAERPYDVVLLDYALPDSVGLPTLKQLLAMTPNSKFAMITGSSGEGVGSVRPKRALGWCHRVPDQKSFARSIDKGSGSHPPWIAVHSC